MATVEIPERAFESEHSFHETFASVMGFPDFYGKNWDAWIDCMSYVDDPATGMSKVTVGKDEPLEIAIVIAKRRYHETRTWADFCSCLAAVNARLARNGSKTRLIIIEKH